MTYYSFKGSFINPFDLNSSFDQWMDQPILNDIDYDINISGNDIEGDISSQDNSPLRQEQIEL